MRVAFTTLGCKINQFETDALRQDFNNCGSTIVPFEAEADVYIVNTCSVTAKSDTQCRQTIRSVIRRVPGAKVVVTGCYASTRPDELAKIPGVDLVIDNREKVGIPQRIIASFGSLRRNDTTAAGHAAVKPVSERTRGFLKIQDGCNNHCSYCIVPLARGASRSTPCSEVIASFDHLVQNGCPEIVLSGIHIGSYGSDLSDKTDLTSLLKILLAKRGEARLRLSSIEPNEITDEMIAMIGYGLCRHLHIPVQSGDDMILKSMKRRYSAALYVDLLEKIAKRVPGIALGADIMVGYPGEGDCEFRNTMQLIERSPLTHLHVFSYSPRPGTSAADMKNQVPDHVKKDRNEELRLLGIKKNREFTTNQVGSVLEAVLENCQNLDTGTLSGLTDNYIRINVEGMPQGKIRGKIMVRLNMVNREGNVAVIV
jgi:threonylcarbamoyladenosine tRNA methylthiotransferase MtaB